MRVCVCGCSCMRVNVSVWVIYYFTYDACFSSLSRNVKNMLVFYAMLQSYTFFSQLPLPSSNWDQFLLHLEDKRRNWVFSLLVRWFTVAKSNRSLVFMPYSAIIFAVWVRISVYSGRLHTYHGRRIVCSCRFSSYVCPSCVFSSIWCLCKMLSYYRLDFARRW